MTWRLWWARIFWTLAPVLVIAGACGGDVSGDSGSGLSCPGAASVCPEECKAETLRPIFANGCLGEPEIVSCKAPEGAVTLDAGCVKRSSDNKHFSVTHGGWPAIEGFEECEDPGNAGTLCTADAQPQTDADAGDGACEMVVLATWCIRVRSRH